MSAMPLTVVPAGRVASAPRVAMPTSVSLRVWSRRMPETRERWSSARRRSLHDVGPAADAAVVDGIGIGGDAGCVVGAVDELFEARLQRAVVGGVVGELEGVRLAVAGDDVHLLRRDALQALDLFGVGAHLEEGGGLHPAGELGVGDLVGPCAEVRARACRRGGGSRRGRASRRGRRWPGRSRRRRTAWRRGSAASAAASAATVLSGYSTSTTFRPSAWKRASCFSSCSPPRRERTSSIGSSRFGRSRSPRSTESSSSVRCSHAE